MTINLADLCSQVPIVFVGSDLMSHAATPQTLIPVQKYPPEDTEIRRLCK